MPDDVFILDSGHTVYVWVGDDARPEEKTMAIDTGLVGFNGSFTVTDSDSYSDSKPYGYIVLCGTYHIAPTRTRIPTPDFCMG